MPGADSLNGVRGTTSSMDTVRVQPRTQRQGAYDTEEVELTLLEDDERHQAAIGVYDDHSLRASRPKPPMSTRDKRSMGLLCILCEFSVITATPLLTPVRFDSGRSCEFLSATFVR